jgi:RTX calcium-binding nonapeptide repeat (4 copies)
MATFIVNPDGTGDFTTIQAAIDDGEVLAGDTIQVVAGTYDEDLVIHKAVAILGAQAGVDGTDAGRDAAGGAGETTIVGRSNITAIGAVTIDGVRFLNDASTTGGGLADPILQVSGSAHLITNSIFYSAVNGGADGVLDAAIALPPIATGALTISDNYFTGAFEGAFSTASWGRGVWSDGGGINVSIAGNTFEFSRTGINLDMTGDSAAAVVGNTFITNGTGTSVNIGFDSVSFADNNYEDTSDDGNDTLRGTAGSDFLDGNASGTPATDNNTLEGRGGNDLLSGSGGNDVLDGGADSDTVSYVGVLTAVVVDLPSHIALGVQIGTDTLQNIENVLTGLGDDAVAADGSINLLSGFAGVDTVSYYLATSGVVVDLAGQTGFDGTSTDTLRNFENVNGSAFNDTISGDSGANVLNGLGGIDTVSYSLESQGVIIDFSGNVAVQGVTVDTILNFENATGSAFNDAISGNSGANVLDGLGGIDTVSYYASSQGLAVDLAFTVAVEGGVIDTILNFENANGSAFDDSVSGNAGANVLNGLGGTDTISYYAAAHGVTIDLAAGTGISGGVTDTLLNFENANGSAHTDTLIGDGVANVLNGLGGADTLTGGGGFDLFELGAGQADGDVITDFTGNGAAAGDGIKLVGFGTAAQGATFTQLNATQWQIHSGLDGHNEIVTLSNGAAVDSTDFFFV